MNTALVKIGGRVAEDPHTLASLCYEMLELGKEHRLVLVHGGGAEVTEVSRKLGMKAVFQNGIRQTSAEEMDVVDMVLAGRINKRIVRLLRARGLDAVGLSGSDGGIFIGRPLDGQDTRTGEVTATDIRLLEILFANGFLPVLCSVSMDPEGRGLNINADTVAFQLAARLKAWALVFFSDTPGILSGGSVVQALTGSEARDLIARGVIMGGMVPKVTASLDAIDQGVSTVIIGQYEGAGSLARLLDGKQGTRLWK
ncbi:MAG: acetylglutamate kinase [Spirochaetia bacterium]